MTAIDATSITVQTTVKAPVSTVWSLWTLPEHITQWCSGSEDWHTPRAENDLQVGGRFLSRMEAKDGSFGFDFTGTYTDVVPNQRICYTIDDGRTVEVLFEVEGDNTLVTTTFEAEKTNPAEMQRAGWQTISDNFKQYAESQA